MLTTRYIIPDINTFELFGGDILMDVHGVPWRVFWSGSTELKIQSVVTLNHYKHDLYNGISISEFLKSYGKYDMPWSLIWRRIDHKTIRER